MNTQTKHLKGFTIIEVVLVLAIAALIFLMVFIALPALQANQRDTARKNDASTVAAAVQSYSSTEREPVAAGDHAGLQRYVDNLDQYEKSAIRVLARLGPATGTTETAIPVNATTTGQIRVFVGNKCSGTSVVPGNTRTAAVVIVLEGGTGNIPHCVDV